MASFFVNTNSKIPLTIRYYNDIVNVNKGILWKNETKHSYRYDRSAAR